MSAYSVKITIHIFHFIHNTRLFFLVNMHNVPAFLLNRKAVFPIKKSAKHSFEIGGISYNKKRLPLTQKSFES